jgi:hypothetical protein
LPTEARPVTTNDEMLATLEKRLGRLHARQRLGIEKDHEAQIFGQGLNFFHIENLTLCAGRWQYHDMIGYTSVGAGCSIVPVRFNCPPEITLHHLYASP